MVDKQRILIVDDDNNIAELISLYLVKECYETLIVNDGESALEQITEFGPDLMLLDIMLPGIDGYEVCRRVRTTSELPIIMLSAKGETFDKVLGLQLGADDYIEKPFDSKEMVARVKAVLRRSASKPAAVPAQENSDIDAVSYPDLIINLTNYSVTYKGRTIEMPPNPSTSLTWSSPVLKPLRTMPTLTASSSAHIREESPIRKLCSMPVTKDSANSSRDVSSSVPIA